MTRRGQCSICRVAIFLNWYITIYWAAIFFSIDIPDDSAVAQKWTDVQLQFSLEPHQWVSVSTHSLHKAEIQLQCQSAFTHTHTHTHTHTDADTHTHKQNKETKVCKCEQRATCDRVKEVECKLIYPIISPGRRSALWSNKIITLLVVIKQRKKYC